MFGSAEFEDANADGLATLNMDQIRNDRDDDGCLIVDIAQCRQLGIVPQR